MKKSLVTLVLMLVIGGLAVAQQAAAPQASAPATQKKEIKDPAEYNAYMGAIQNQDAAGKATALEAFTTQYPNSVMKEDALELLMRTYQQLGNVPKTDEAAQKVLQANPNNVTALALLAYTKRVQAQSGQNPGPNLADASQYGQKGLTAIQTYPKPEGMTDEQFTALKTQLTGIFNAAIGINLLQSKDYAGAQKALTVAVQSTPTDFSLVYPLALAELENPMPDYNEGLWTAARAVSLAPAQLKNQISEYGRRKYIKFHGGDDGWTDVLTQAAATPAKPADFAIKPAPTPAELAAKLLTEKSVDKMSFDEFQMILTSGNQQAADQLWMQIKDKPLAIQGKLVSGETSKLMIAGSYDDITANKADIELALAAPAPAAGVTKLTGQDVQFQGTPTAYTAMPFMVTMSDGRLIGDSAKALTPAPAARKPAAARRAAPTKKP